MLFNVKKCKVLHIGYNNAYCDYTCSMNCEILQSVTEETDLGIIVSNDLKPSKQCVSAVKKTNMTLGMIKRHIVSRDIKFSFLKEGLPSLKTACAPCMLGSPPKLVIFYTTQKPRHRRTSTIAIEWISKILFWQKKKTNSYLKRHLAPYTVGL